MPAVLFLPHSAYRLVALLIPALLLRSGLRLRSGEPPEELAWQENVRKKSGSPDLQTSPLHNELRVPVLLLDQSTRTEGDEESASRFHFGASPWIDHLGLYTSNVSLGIFGFIEVTSMTNTLFTPLLPFTSSDRSRKSFLSNFTIIKFSLSRKVLVRGTSFIW